MSGKSQFADWSLERVAAMSARNRAAHLPAQATLDVSTVAGDEIRDDGLEGIRVTSTKRKVKPAPPQPKLGERPWPVFEAMLRSAKLPAPQYEFQFDAVRKWRFDVAFPEHRIALEVDGGIWSGGAHGRPQGILNAMEKGNAAQIAGWRFLRYTPDNLARAVDDLKAMLA